MIDDVTRSHADADRVQAAKQLWDFAVTESLLSLIGIIPTQQTSWAFDTDDEMFDFERTAVEPIQNFDTWKCGIGIEAGQFPLSCSSYK